jgi:retron-type reverse transcriptase
MNGYVDLRVREYCNAQEAYRERRRRREEQRRAAEPVSVALLTERSFMYNCWEKLKREGGPAPGPDRMSYDDLTPVEISQILPTIQTCLERGLYRPHETRPVAIPKPGSHERRVLHLGNIFDRLVGKMLQETLAPRFEPLFLKGSWGFRAGRSPWGMLAALEATMICEDRWVLAIDDIYHAFDEVQLKAVMAAHRRLLTTLCPERVERTRMLDLIERVLQGHDPHRRKGIDQGNPYSPTALNVLLHCVHDAPLTAGVCFPPWLRYADNVVYPCRSVSEGRQILDRTRQLLRAVNMDLKGKDGVVDLAAGDNAQLLGVTVQQQGRRLAYSLDERAWDQLAEYLDKTYANPNPTSTAIAVVKGWITAYGAVFESGEPVVERVLRVAADHGYRELSSPGDLHKHWENVRRGWQDLRPAVLSKDGGM